MACQGPGEGPYARFEARVAAAHEQIVHLTMPGRRHIDHLARIGDAILLQVSAPHGWFNARGRRIQDVAPDGMTIRITQGPERIERREYLRVRCDQPFRWRALNQSELDQQVEAMRSGRVVRHTHQVDPLSPQRLREVAEPDMARLLERLVERIETLEAQVAGLMANHTDEHHAGHKDSIIDLSGSGMRFTTQIPVRTGDAIEATLDMSAFGQPDLHLIARVVRIDPPNLGRATPGVACRYTYIDDRDREILIRFAFREHRRQLRESI